MQQALPFKGKTLCGYCLRDCEPVDKGGVVVFECPRCAPLLPEIATVEDFKRFRRRAWKGRVR